MNEPGGEEFEKTYRELTGEKADEKINEELNALGGIEDVEKAEARDFMIEARRDDAEAIAYRPEISKEGSVLAWMLGYTDDMLTYHGVDDWAPVETIIQDLTTKQGVEELTETIDPKSKFHKHPDAVADYVKVLKNLLELGLITRRMNLITVQETVARRLEELSSSKERADDLDRLETLRNERKNLFSVLQTIETATKEGASVISARREKNELRIALQARDREMATRVAAAISIPGIALSMSATVISLRGMFDPRFLNEAQKQYPWIRS